jgi:hypothetical protein
MANAVWRNSSLEDLFQRLPQHDLKIASNEKIYDKKVLANFVTSKFELYAARTAP